MPILNLPDTIEIPFETLTNEQRKAIHTVMTGKGLRNPLLDKINQCRDAINVEKGIIQGFSLDLPLDPDGGPCQTCPISSCPGLLVQQRAEIQYQLELLLYWLDVLELHTDKVSGANVAYIDTFFQRLSALVIIPVQ